MFKKPKRNFRARRTNDSGSGDDFQASVTGEDAGEGDENVFQAASNMRKSLNKKKKNRSAAQTEDGGVTTAKSTLSFGEEINEGNM